MLSSRKCAPIDDFIKAGILPMLTEFLTPKYNDKYDFAKLLKRYENKIYLLSVDLISSMNVHGY